MTLEGQDLNIEKALEESLQLDELSIERQRGIQSARYMCTLISNLSMKIRSTYYHPSCFSFEGNRSALSDVTPQSSLLQRSREDSLTEASTSAKK